MIDSYSWRHSQILSYIFYIENLTSYFQDIFFIL